MEYIIHTRLLQKSLPQGIVERKSLFKQLSLNGTKNLVLICAPAGYGKTTLVQDFIAKEGVKYSWLHVHGDMDNFYTFIAYLTYSLKKLNDEFGKGTIALIEDYRERLQLSKQLDRIINDVVTVFLNEFITCFNEDINVVIDDLSNIKGSEWQSKTFNTIFDNIPPNMHFIITTRELPEFNLNQLQVKRNILKIDSASLAFSSKEIDELLKTNYDISCSETDIRVLQNNLEGWITGIHLVIQNFGKDFIKLRLDKLIILEDIFNYFTEDIFQSLDSDTRKFLLLTSLLDGFTESLCDYIFNTNDSRKIIEGLLNKNIFIYVDAASPSQKEVSYVYHGLFKNFLNSKLKETTSEQEISEFFGKVAAYYLEKKDYLKATNYSLSSGDRNTSVKLIQDNFFYFFDKGNIKALSHWFENLDEETVSTSAKLLYYKALVLKFYSGDTEGTFPYLDRAITTAQDEGDTELMIKCYLIKSRNLINIGRINDAIKNLNELISKNIKSESLYRQDYLLAFAHYQNGDYDKSLVLLDKAVDELEHSEETKSTKDVKLDIFNLYGHIYLIRGDYSKSISYYEQVVNKSKRVLDKYETYCNLILLYSQSGKFEKALEYLEDAREITDTISIPILKITFLLASQSLKFGFGDYEASITLLEELNRIAATINHKYYIYLSYSLIGDSYYYLHSVSKAEEYYDLAFNYINDESRHEKIQYAFTKALLLKADKPFDEIEKVLLEAYEYYSENKFSYDKTQTAFHLADYYYKIKNFSTALKYLTEAVNMAKEKEYSSFLQRDFTDMRYLFDFAVANKIQKDFIKTLIQSIISQKGMMEVSPEAEKRLESKIDSVYDIELRTFGKGELYIRGSLIEESQWSKKKWKLIFIYLMLHSKRKLTKDKVIDEFYPDTAIESADNIFHQIVSKFRNLIKITDPAESEPQPGSVKGAQKKKKNESEKSLISPLVIYEDKTLEINDNYMYYIDCNEFESLYKKASAERNPEQRLELLKKAAELYKGDFLEGNYETWVEELKTKFKSYFISISEELIKTLFEGRDYDETLEYAENLLRFENLNLVAYEYSIKSYEQLDKHKQAREKYSRLIKSYESEYGEKLPKSFTSKLSEIV